MTKGFAYVIKLNVLKWEDYPELSGWAQYNHKRPYQEMREAREPKKRWRRPTSERRDS